MNAVRAALLHPQPLWLALGISRREDHDYKDHDHCDDYGLQNHVDFLISCMLMSIPSPKTM